MAAAKGQTQQRKLELLITAVDQTNQVLAGLGTSLQRVASLMEETNEKAAKSAEKAARSMDSETQAAERLEKALGRARTVSEALTTAGNNLAVVGLALTAAFSVVTREALNFERAMARVKAYVGGSEEEFKALTERAKELGTTTQYSAAEVADGMKILGQAGFTAKEVMVAIVPTLRMAAAGELGMGEAAYVASNTLRAFQMDVTELSRVVDVLAKAAAETNADIHDFGESMKYAAPYAAAAGVSIEATAAMLGILANNGRKGTLGGTDFKNIMLGLTAVIPNATKAMADMGVQMKYFDDGTLDLIGSLRVLKDSMQLTVPLAVDIARREGSVGLLALTNQIGKVEELYATLMKADGAAQAMANTILTNLWGALLKLTNQVRVLAIDVMGPALKTIAKVASVLQDVVKGFSDATKAGGGLGPWIGSLTGVLGATILILGSLIGVIGVGVKIIVSLYTGFERAAVIIKQYTVATEAAAAANVTANASTNMFTAGLEGMTAKARAAIIVFRSLALAITSAFAIMELIDLWSAVDGTIKAYHAMNETMRNTAKVIEDTNAATGREIDNQNELIVLLKAGQLAWDDTNKRYRNTTDEEKKLAEQRRISREQLRKEASVGGAGIDKELTTAALEMSVEAYARYQPALLAFRKAQAEAMPKETIQQVRARNKLLMDLEISEWMRGPQALSLSMKDAASKKENEKNIAAGKEGVAVTNQYEQAKSLIVQKWELTTEEWRKAHAKKRVDEQKKLNEAIGALDKMQVTEQQKVLEDQFKRGLMGFEQYFETRKSLTAREHDIAIKTARDNLAAATKSGGLRDPIVAELKVQLGIKEEDKKNAMAELERLWQGIATAFATKEIDLHRAMMQELLDSIPADFTNARERISIEIGRLDDQKKLMAMALTLPPEKVAELAGAIDISTQSKTDENNRKRLVTERTIEQEMLAIRTAGLHEYEVAALQRGEIDALLLSQEIERAQLERTLINSDIEGQARLSLATRKTGEEKEKLLEEGTAIIAMNNQRRLDSEDGFTRQLEVLLRKQVWLRTQNQFAINAEMRAAQAGAAEAGAFVDIGSQIENQRRAFNEETLIRVEGLRARGAKEDEILAFFHLREKERITALTNLEQESWTTRLSTASTTMSSMADAFGNLHKAFGRHTRAFFVMQQTAAVGQAMIDGALAIMSIQKLWAGVPYVMYPLMALQAASTGAQMAVIYAQKPPAETMAKGGKVRGGSGAADDVPIMAMGGEYVLRKAAVQRYGVGFIEALNRGIVDLPGRLTHGLSLAIPSPAFAFAGGGLVSSGADFPVTIKLENQTGTVMKMREKAPVMDGKKMVKSIILELADTDPSFIGFMKSMGRQS